MNCIRPTEWIEIQNIRTGGYPTPKFLGVASVVAPSMRDRSDRNLRKANSGLDFRKFYAPWGVNFSIF